MEWIFSWGRDVPLCRLPSYLEKPISCSLRRAFWDRVFQVERNVNRTVRSSSYGRSSICQSRLLDAALRGGGEGSNNHGASALHVKPAAVRLMLTLPTLAATLMSLLWPVITPWQDLLNRAARRMQPGRHLVATWRLPPPSQSFPSVLLLFGDADSSPCRRARRSSTRRRRSTTPRWRGISACHPRRRRRISKR